MEKEFSEKLEYNEYLQRMRIIPQAKDGIGRYFKCRSGDNLYYQTWNRVTKPQKILIGIHGMASHGIEYVQVADQLAKNNVIIYAPDLKHHGKSSGIKGDIENFEEIIDQVNEFISFLKNKHDNIPIFLMGISLGSTVAINYQIMFPNTLKGLILNSPAVKTKLHLSFSDFVESPLYLLTYLFFRGKPMIDLRKRSARCSRNPWRIKFEENDELHLKKISLRYLLQGNAWDIKAFKGAEKISCPVLILQGTSDSTVTYKGVEEFFNRIPIKDKKLVEFKGAYHCILSDPVMIEQDGWKILRNWILSH